MRANAVPRMPPTSCTRTTPMSRVQRGAWGCVGERGSYCGKNSTARAPAHRSGPGPIMLCTYMWPRPGGSCRCTKTGVPFCTPLLVHGQSQPHAPGHPWRGRRSKTTRQPEQRQDKNTESRGARRTPPVRPLPGRPPQPRQEPCRSNSPDTSRAATLEPKSSNTINHIGTKAREAPPWWHADLCEDH